MLLFMTLPKPGVTEILFEDKLGRKKKECLDDWNLTLYAILTGSK